MTEQSEERRTIRNWASRLTMEDELLTLDQAKGLALILMADRALETRDLISDIQMRLMRMEQFLSGVYPNYDQYVRMRLERAEAEKHQSSALVPVTNGRSTYP